MAPSKAEKKSFYSLILSFIFMLHVGALAIKLRVFETKLDKTGPLGPLVVKLITDVKQQIVQSEDSETREIKDKSFLSDKTRSFDRQTRARVTDLFNQGRKREGAKMNGSKDIKLSDLGAAAGGDPFKKAAKNYRNKNGQMGQHPSKTVSSTNDFIQDISLGDLTYLNTVEYKYYGFYHRIRQKLEQFWGRSLHAKAEQLAKEGRHVPTEEELITALQITLDHEGEIVAIKVKGSSGIKELDDAAIESFNEAGPFPNPPRDLIVNGTVTLEWGFVVKS
jgi:TonB family protein